MVTVINIRGLWFIVLFLALLCWAILGGPVPASLSPSSDEAPYSPDYVVLWPSIIDFERIEEVMTGQSSDGYYNPDNEGVADVRSDYGD